jgi:hypothetical protein
VIRVYDEAGNVIETHEHAGLLTHRVEIIKGHTRRFVILPCNVSGIVKCKHVARKAHGVAAVYDKSHTRIPNDDLTRKRPGSLPI